MPCCKRPAKLPEITTETELILVKPFKTIKSTEQLNMARFSVKVTLLDLGYAKIKN